MKALVLQQAGTTPLMVIEERPMPVVAAGQSLVRVHAATANPLSQLLRSGQLPIPALPLVLSNDGAGVVEHSQRFAAGTPVLIYGGEALGITQDGLQQQWVAIDDARLIELPAGLSLDEGAALPINYLTAFQALNRVGQVRAGQDVLVSGASGSVGQALVQTALALGARPIAVVSTSAKVEQARQAGAQRVIDLSRDVLRERVLAFTDGQGADLALDTVGGSLTGALLAALRPRGCVVCIGFVGGKQAQIDVADVVIHEKRIAGYDAHLETPADIAAAFERILHFVAQGLLKPRIDSRYPLERHADAYARLTSREATGAILLHP